MHRVTPAEPPRADTRPHFKQWFPWLVPAFVVTNVIIFFITMYKNNCPRYTFPPDYCFASFLGRFSFQPLEQNQLLGPSSDTLLKMGALYVEKGVDIDLQTWHLFSSMWLHAGVIHLLLNMLALIIFGIHLEKKFGFVKIGFLYVISGLGGSLLSALFIKYGITIGASGAIFGLIGGMLSELLTNWTIHTNKFVKMLIIIVSIIPDLVLGMIIPHVDNFGHIGGLLSGFLSGFVLLLRPHYKWVNRRNSQYVILKYKHYQYVLWLISFILLSVGLIVGLILLDKGVDLNDHCSWCHYLTCIPISKGRCKPQGCQVSLIENQINITCLNNGRSGIFSVSRTNPFEQEQELCIRLCG